MRRAKIVATIGPAIESPEKISEAIKAGLNVARLNMSHGDHAEHQARYNTIREESAKLGKDVAILADLQGPKIRLERFANGKEYLEPGADFTITSEDVEGTAEICGTTYKGLPGDVKLGDKLLLDDGKIRLEAIEVTPTRVRTRVVVGGPISNNKGINLPGAAVSLPALTEKDANDLRFALKMGADIIALSFVRTGADVDPVHKIMEEEGIRVPVIAKIEKPQAVENLQDIIDKFDGIMVARGDLGVELPFSEVPLVQKKAIDMARRWAKPVIVATQVLESMTDNPVPTRAEVSDCANAILDGADAVMLSGETSVGKYPILTLQAMAAIVQDTEKGGLYRVPELDRKPRTRGGAITRAAVNIADQLDAKLIVTFTQSGDSARRLARLRPETPIVAFTTSSKVRSFLSMLWGVDAEQVEMITDQEAIFTFVDEYLLKNGLAEAGDLVVVAAGAPAGRAGTTNMVQVHRVYGAEGEREALRPYEENEVKR